MKKIIAILLALSLFTMNVYATGETCTIDPFSDYEWKAYYKPGTKDTTGDLSLQVGDIIYLTKNNEYLYPDSTTGTTTDTSSTVYYQVLSIDGTNVHLQSLTPVSYNYKTAAKKTVQLNLDKASCIAYSTLQLPNKFENACDTCFTYVYDYQSVDDLYLDSNNPNDSTLSYYEKLVRAGLGSAIVKKQNLEEEYYAYYNSNAINNLGIALDNLDLVYDNGSSSGSVRYQGFKMLGKTIIGDRNVYVASLPEIMPAWGYIHNTTTPSTLNNIKVLTISDPVFRSNIMNFKSTSSTSQQTDSRYKMTISSYPYYQRNWNVGTSNVNHYPSFTLDFATLGITLDGIN